MKKKIIISAVVMVSIILLVIVFKPNFKPNEHNVVPAVEDEQGNDMVIEDTSEEPQLIDSYEYILASGIDGDGSEWYMVGENIESYEGSYIQIGVIKNNKWVVEMTKDCPFIEKEGSLFNGAVDSELRAYYVNDYEAIGKTSYFPVVTNDKELELSTFYYLGNGCFALSGIYAEDEVNKGYSNYYANYDYMIWNTNNGKSKSVKNVIIRDTENITDYKNILFLKRNDYSRETNMGTFEIDSLNCNDFSVHKVVSKNAHFQDITFSQSSDDMFLLNYEKKNGMDAYEFYSIDGKKAFDLQKYNDTNVGNIDEVGHFNDGKCDVNIRINSGKKYIITIDKSGKVIDNQEIEE